MEIIAAVIVLTLLLYVICGVLFTIFFQVWGLKKIDEDVPGSTWGFRVIIIPGCIALWPVLMKKWFTSSKNNHGKIIT
jgi:hypothetical protein